MGLFMAWKFFWDRLPSGRSSDPLFTPLNLRLRFFGKNDLKMIDDVRWIERRIELLEIQLEHRNQYYDNRQKWESIFYRRMWLEKTFQLAMIIQSLKVMKYQINEYNQYF